MKGSKYVTNLNELKKVSVELSKSLVTLSGSKDDYRICLAYCDMLESFKYLYSIKNNKSYKNLPQAKMIEDVFILLNFPTSLSEGIIRDLVSYRNGFVHEIHNKKYWMTQILKYRPVFIKMSENLIKAIEKFTEQKIRISESFFDID